MVMMTNINNDRNGDDDFNKINHTSMFSSAVCLLIEVYTHMILNPASFLSLFQDKGDHKKTSVKTFPSRVPICFNRSQALISFMLDWTMITRSQTVMTHSSSAGVRE